MKKETVEKIVENAENGKNTIIGKYTYTANFYIGKIVRCKTDDTARTWLDHLGRICSGWESICDF